MVVWDGLELSEIVFKDGTSFQMSYQILGRVPGSWGSSVRSQSHQTQLQLSLS